MRHFINIVENAQAEPLVKNELWNGKNVVDRVGDYFIAVNNLEAATFVTVWTKDNKRVGELSTRQTPDQVGQDYLGISRAELKSQHRGKGLGFAMYKVLLAHLDPKWKGISSYLPDQANRKQVPKIWQRLGGVKIGDHIVANRKR